MTGRLLERDAELGLLQDGLRQAGRGRGSVVLVSGEAGIGKTSLVRAFAERARGRARVLVGVCDDLVTPRTLGPFRDMARGTDGPLHAAVEATERDAIFGAVHQELAARPTAMIVEDVHWADDATLDVVRHLSWRVAELPSMLLLTYRDDAVGDDHPLRQVLGALARQGVRRLALRRLSAGAVQELSAARGVDGRAVLHATGGNPFFVTEVLASPEVDVPATVRDAVLARLGELDDATRRALELLSTVPGLWSAGSPSACSPTGCPRSRRPSAAASWRPTPRTSGSATSSPAARSSRHYRSCAASSSTRRSSPRCTRRSGRRRRG
jgi:hypothetical protein